MRGTKIGDRLDLDVTVRDGTTLEHFPDWRVTKDSGVQQLRKLAADIDAKTKKIATSGDFTPSGKTKRLRETLTDAVSTISTWRDKNTRGLRERRSALLAELRASAESDPSDSAEALRRELRHREIRSHLPPDFDPTMADVLYPSLPEEAQAALREAPPRIVQTEGGFDTRPLVSEETVEKHAAAAARATNPEKAALLEEVGYLIGMKEALARNALEEVRGAAESVGVGQEVELAIDGDPVAKLAEESA